MRVWLYIGLEGRAIYVSVSVYVSVCREMVNLMWLGGKLYYRPQANTIL